MSKIAINLINPSAVLLLSSLVINPCNATEPTIAESAEPTKANSVMAAGGEFTLYGADGAISLSDYRGKVVAVYFGYTLCPDICPTNLALLSSAMNQLSSSEIDEFQGIFISVDPGRDSPDKLKEYVQYFHKNLVGISGAPDDLNPVVMQYGAHYEYTPYSNSELLYGVAHTSETYIIDKKGKLSTVLPHATSASEILAAIREAAKR